MRTRSDLAHLFGDRLFVELAPLEGLLDSVGDKIVRRAQPTRTEIFVVRKGRMIRTRAAEGFQPGALVDAVRAYDRTAIQATLRVRPRVAA